MWRGRAGNFGCGRSLAVGHRLLRDRKRLLLASENNLSSCPGLSSYPRVSGACSCREPSYVWSCDVMSRALTRAPAACRKACGGLKKQGAFFEELNRWAFGDSIYRSGRRGVSSVTSGLAYIRIRQARLQRPGLAVWVRHAPATA